MKTPAPLYRDPIFDGATDPMLIFHEEEKIWYMFYTQRRAFSPDIGVAWVHGTDIGVATSDDGGKFFMYRGVLDSLRRGHGHNTYWAPEVVYHDGTYHMYVSVIQGVPHDWHGNARIHHYTSRNLWDWEFQSVLDFDSPNNIDACIHRLNDTTWRMWYKETKHYPRQYTCIADSTDLYNWEMKGTCVDDNEHEGPNVFALGGYYWLITDPHVGLHVYRSTDLEHWDKQEGALLFEGGTRPDDNMRAHHADIVSAGDVAYIFYFVHPGIPAGPEYVPESNGYHSKRSAVQAALLRVVDGRLVCDRNEDFEICLPL